jgi:Mor family transcriptional regulator
MSEFIDEIRHRIISQAATMGITPETAALIATEVAGSVARDYAGERVYIGKRDEEQCVMSARNRSIIRDHRSGERVALLSRRYGISRKRVYEIVNGE